MNHFKRCVIPVATPLLSNRMLDLITRIPALRRGDKRWSYDGLRQTFPKVAEIPYARWSNLERWDRADFRSGWFQTVLDRLTAAPASRWDEYFDRAALIRCLEGIRRGEAAGSLWSVRIKERIKRMPIPAALLRPLWRRAHLHVPLAPISPISRALVLWQDARWASTPAGASGVNVR